MRLTHTALLVGFILSSAWAIGCTGQMGTPLPSEELLNNQLVGAGCDPDSFARCAEDSFVCVVDDAMTKRCEGQAPAVPDGGGGWQCHIDEGIRVCMGDHYPDLNVWTCFALGDGTVRCSAPSYSPDSEAGVGPWDCFFNDEFIVCEWENAHDVEPTDDPTPFSPYPNDEPEDEEPPAEEPEEEEPEPPQEEEQVTPPEDETEPPEETIEEEECLWPEEAVVESCQYENSWDDHVGHCNSEPGTEDRLDICLATNDWMPCDADEQYAWCTRRVPGMTGAGGPWYEYLRQWVENRHGGGVTATFYDSGTGPLADNDHGYDYFMVDDSVGCRRYMCTTPLVLSFEATGAFTMIPDDGFGFFDLSLEQDGSATRTDWPSAATPWLAIDLDDDGMITSGRELFGTASLVAGFPVSNGFQALAAFDDNNDNVIDARDAVYDRLLLWSDFDANRVSSDGELQSIKMSGVTALGLGYSSDPSCDERGNCGIERASFTFIDSSGQDQTGVVVDIHLAL